MVLLWLAGAMLTQFGYSVLHRLNFQVGIGPEDNLFWYLGYGASTAVAAVFIIYPMIRLIKELPELQAQAGSGEVARAVLRGMCLAWASYLVVSFFSVALGAPPAQAVAVSIFFGVFSLVGLFMWTVLIPIPILLYFNNRGSLAIRYILILGGLSALAFWVWLNVDIARSGSGASSFGRSLGDVSVNGRPTNLGWLLAYINGLGSFAFGVLAGVFAAQRLVRRKDGPADAVQITNA